VTLIITDTIIECADVKLTTAQRERLPNLTKDLLNLISYDKQAGIFKKLTGMQKLYTGRPRFQYRG
jgi:hypothetical protein